MQILEARVNCRRECFLQKLMRQNFISNKPPGVENTRPNITVNVSNSHNMDIYAKTIFNIGLQWAAASSKQHSNRKDFIL